MSEISETARLAPLRLAPLLAGAAGGLLLRPWFDALALPAILRWYFPLSRAWAAAELAGLDRAAFCDEIPEAAPWRPLLAPALAATARRARAHRAATAEWEAAFFGADAVSASRLIAAEHARLAAAHAWMAARNAFLPLHAMRPFPAVKWQLPRDAEVEERHAIRLADPTLAFPAPALSTIDPSRWVEVEGGRTRWLRFPSSVAGRPDTAWARVVEPEGVVDPPSLVFLHGIGVETEFWRGDIGRIDTLLRAGIRIIRPEAPWHGRRRAAGWFGGENVMAQGPLGLIELFAAWVSEIAALIAWARATSRGRVALGGISLGALTSQIAGVAAGGWPPAMRPDALLLVGTTADVIAAAVTGGIGRGLGIAARLAALSWPAASVERWRPLLEPRRPPEVPPESILLVIGTDDDVMPFAGALELARRWAVPEANIFRRRQGHFTLAMGLERDAAPLRRLAELLQR
jgi:pimeloyl-ACP methyl ester carboxylesterase